MAAEDCTVQERAPTNKRIGPVNTGDEDSCRPISSGPSNAGYAGERCRAQSVTASLGARGEVGHRGVDTLLVRRRVDCFFLYGIDAEVCTIVRGCLFGCTEYISRILVPRWPSDMMMNGRHTGARGVGLSHRGGGGSPRIGY